MPRRNCRHGALAKSALPVVADPLSELPVKLPLTPSDPTWVDAVLGSFDEFLADHASCEKKASGMALNVASHYPDRPQLLQAMADLAVEELSHYREVVKLLLSKGLQPSADRKDPYVRELNQCIRKGSELFLLDRLLVAAVVEARGCERFGLIESALPPGPEKKFYAAITASEDRHWQLFIQLATNECPDAPIMQRLQELVLIEGQLLQDLPVGPHLH